MTIGDVPDDITIRVNNDPVEKVKQFKYLGSLKSTDGDCSKDVNARIAMAKRRMCEHLVEGSIHPSRTQNETG